MTHYYRILQNDYKKINRFLSCFSFNKHIIMFLFTAGFVFCVSLDI